MMHAQTHFFLSRTQHTHRDTFAHPRLALCNQCASNGPSQVHPADISAYLVYHNRKLYASAYCPHAMSFPVFRPQHAPEGNVAIMVRAINVCAACCEVVWCLVV